MFRPQTPVFVLGSALHSTHGKVIVVKLCSSFFSFFSFYYSYSLTYLTLNNGPKVIILGFEEYCSIHNFY